MKRLKSIMVFGNLNVAAFDQDGQQVPELQKSVAALIAEAGERLGYELEGTVIETDQGNWRLHKQDDGWNRVKL